MLGRVEQEDKKKEKVRLAPQSSNHLIYGYRRSIVFNGPNWKTKDYKIKTKYSIKLAMVMRRSEFHI